MPRHHDNIRLSNTPENRVYIYPLYHLGYSTIKSQYSSKVVSFLPRHYLRIATRVCEQSATISLLVLEYLQQFRLNPHHHDPQGIICCLIVTS